MAKNLAAETAEYVLSQTKELGAAFAGGRTEDAGLIGYDVAVSEAEAQLAHKSEMSFTLN